jgi:AraC family transcriptional regulator
LQAAATMLRHSPLPLKEVAVRTGFYSARHLMKAFLRAHGETPQQYRKRKKE